MEHIVWQLPRASHVVVYLKTSTPGWPEPHVDEIRGQGTTSKWLRTQMKASISKWEAMCKFQLNVLFLRRCTKNASTSIYASASIHIDSVIAGGQDQNSNRLRVHLMPICVCARVCLLLKSAYLHSFRLRNGTQPTGHLEWVGFLTRGKGKGRKGWGVRVTDLGS